MAKRKQLFLKSKTYSDRAQAIVEFAIVLPILLALLVGIFEVGRYMFIYSAVTNASRNAVRYASAVGLNDSGLHKYKHCAGIKNVAVKSAFLVPASNLTISISYDTGPGSSAFVVCDAGSGEDADVIVISGNRVNVNVSAQYRPILNPSTITSSSYRTILGIVDLVP